MFCARLAEIPLIRYAVGMEWCMCCGYSEAVSWQQDIYFWEGECS